MKTILYDGSFDGLLTAFFEIYEYRLQDVEIVNQNKQHQENIFAEIHEVVTQQEKAERVLKKLEKNIGNVGISKLLKVYFSESNHLEMLIFYAIQQCIQHPGKNVLQNYADEHFLEISKIVKSVDRERHRMTAFVRFEKLKDDTFFAKIDPDFNVIPLIRKHFKERYQDQKWMIYDLKRNYGVFYDLTSCDFFYPQEPFQLQSIQEKFSEEEGFYQVLWQRYFTKTNIVERKNTKLHLQHVPKRYWKYLTEKN